MLMPELLELILLALPPQDLLVSAQLVSRAWKDAIDSSVTLQQALFFRPSPVSDSHQPMVLNPLLQKAFPPWFRADQKVLNGPMLIAVLPWTASANRLAAFMRADASWRKMLPCQPAKRVLEVAGKINDARGIRETNGTAQFDEGIRMGTLYDFGIDVVRKFSSSFWILWDEEGTERDRVTMFAHHSWFKSGPRRPPHIGDEFRSDAYEELTIDVREEPRSRSWHAGFGNQPNGSWQLRVPSAPVHMGGQEG
ncbi:hypothetical protein GE09DRAFT_1049533 [Coniochaeta sp. 2T2.1]|nr:hypothetical protein GE09DRAFT_1049533 [Coniochaeta sp. 2T2.1]